MSHIFYDHLVNRHELTAEIDNYELEAEDRQELLDLIDETLHHHILNVILNHLPKDHHVEFMILLKTAPHDPQILEFIKPKITIDIESEIIIQAAKVKKEIVTEITKSRLKKPLRK